MPALTTPDGGSLFYDSRGAGKPLVCHPGGPGLPGSLFGDLGGLARSRTLIVLDPRGAGRSEQPRSADAYALDDYVSDLRHVQEHLGLDQIDLLGHSHGSFVALLYAARYPEMVGRLVLVTAGLRFSEAEVERMQVAAQQRSGEPWFDDASAALQEEEEGRFGDDAELGRIFARMLPFYFAHYGEKERAFARLAFERPLHAAAKRYFDAHEFLTFDLRPHLTRVTAPTLVVAGQKDFILPPAACREVADGIPNASLVVLEDVGHFPWVERPEEFTRLVSEFLD
ncbi:MAG TPA: alpha/beta hydrolase [Solirubrobacterales bacterium]|nr:alpha/beta hydrolase [Solirubrobacterales bacterium]